MKLIPSVKKSAMLQKLFYRLTGLMTKSVNHYLDFYCIGQTSNDPRPEDGYFQTADGRRLPVFKNYRYSIKPGWNYFPSLAALRTLIQKDLVLPKYSPSLMKPSENGLCNDPSWKLMKSLAGLRCNTKTFFSRDARTGFSARSHPIR